MQTIPRQEAVSSEAPRDLFDLMDSLAAEEICGQATIIAGNFLIRLYCKRFRVCAKCFERRVKEWGKWLFGAARSRKRETWRYKTVSHAEAARIRRELDHYFSFPMESGTVIVSPQLREGERLPKKLDEIEGLMRAWAMTPEGMRPSRSHNFVHQPERIDRGPTYLVCAPMGYIVEMARAMGGMAEEGKDRGEFIYVEGLELVYVLLLAGKKVKKIHNSVIEIMSTSDTIFSDLQLKWKNGPPKVPGDAPLVG